MMRNQKGFTLIEIIAVLVILGILAAVAIPKYLDISTRAREMSAQGAIAEIKGRLSMAQAKYMMANSGSAPNSTTLLAYANAPAQFVNQTNLMNVGPDFNLTSAVGTGNITITVTNVGGINIANNIANFVAAGD
jgi:prepilin-type N-terminal cleavage/methylation domain-containing protein